LKSGEGRQIAIQEVSSRDGFQAEKHLIPTEEKVEYIDRLSRLGLAKIEVSSFTSPTAVPTLADAAEVFARIERVPGVCYAALVPNLRGCDRALQARVDEINLVMSASESHNKANLRMSCEQSLVQFESIVAHVEGSTPINASLSTAFGCPFEGITPPSRVFELLDKWAAMGITRASLCDTTGIANPAQVFSLFHQVRERWPQVELTAHFHNTRGMGLANALAAIEAGTARFDASLGGLGGCPFAPGATGNVCTEDLVHMLEAMGFNTGVDLTEMLLVAADLKKMVRHDLPGQVVKAGPWTKRYPFESGKGAS
jgi:hydroxymethylglutaryl-CoA lyase